MSSPQSPRSTIDDTAREALQVALAAEHAALWAYSLIVAFLPEAQVRRAREDAAAHRSLRGLVEQTLTDIGAKPVSAQPAYASPEPVTDTRSAGALAVVAETDAMAAWRSVLEHTTDAPLRKAALDALTQATLRCARWRSATGMAPAIPVFPGRP
ncbi:ferritin-like domain-containing protein [Pseudonocardia bannensis]|uniref:Ferritin-like domain-containing protein n=1 Tax=Pseudonocardia bannensis TaxID=630973 RepID=A0A848DJM8_9PSEU|nr:ferritin-like domain-containing protein [Pseudonocardia bannensis]NMH92920.1 ferritin-like domain-containing protein [Pseudonocardia bannensis]